MIAAENISCSLLKKWYFQELGIGWVTTNRRRWRCERINFLNDSGVISLSLSFYREIVSLWPPRASVIAARACYIKVKREKEYHKHSWQDLSSSPSGFVSLGIYNVKKNIFHFFTTKQSFSAATQSFSIYKMWLQTFTIMRESRARGKKHCDTWNVLQN